MVRFNLMRGTRDKIKTVNAKLKSGMLEYPGMDPQEPIVYFGQPAYTMFDQQTKKIELFYDITTKRLLKLNELGGSPQTDAIADLTRNFTIAAKNAKANMGAADDMNKGGKFMLAMLVVVAIVGMITIYMFYSQASAAAGQTRVPPISNAVNNSNLIHIGT